MHLRQWMCGLAIASVLVGPVWAKDVSLKIIALNDFHGNLQSPGKMRSTPKGTDVPVGGAEMLAGYVAKLKAENPTNVVVGAGDIIGASPLVSSLFDDEDTIDAMNRTGLEITSVGNHEFDKGWHELQRKQKGGCAQDGKSCKGVDGKYGGAKFEYLAANVVVTATGKTLFPAYAIRTYHGVKVAFIGLTLKDTPAIVVSKNVEGLSFSEEAPVINGIVAKLKSQGVKSFVVLIHQGGFQSTRGPVDISACEGGLKGSEIAAIVNKLDDAVGLVISAHTHAAYVCHVANSVGREIPVTSASAFGRVVTDIDVTMNAKLGTITAVKAQNVLVDRTAGVPPNAEVAAMLDKYVTLSLPLVNREEGSVTADIGRRESAAGESPLGDLIADAQLDATRASGAQVAFMNSGGIRADLKFSSGIDGVVDGKVVFGELFTTQPFGNTLVTLTLTGAQLKTMLEEQFRGCGANAGSTRDNVLQVSKGFKYSYDPKGPACAKVNAASIQVDGKAWSATGKYRVSVNNLLADGGDGLPVLKEGTDRVTGSSDVDAMVAYFAKHPVVSPPVPSRISVAP